MYSKKHIKRILIINSHGRSGGCVMLSLLCKLLADRGYDARLMIFPYIDPINQFSKIIVWRDWLRYHLYNWMRNKINQLMDIFHCNRRLDTWDFSYEVGKECKQYFNPFFSRRHTLVIYPEVLYGNFLGSRYVVRWLLYHYRYSGDMEAYNKEDLFICYRKIFNDWNLNPSGIETPLTYLERNRFRQYNFGLRKDHCFLLRKGHFRDDLPKKFDAPVIDFASSDDEICRMFNEYTFCYFYDTQTFYTTFAVICGCIPIVIPESGKSRSDYRKESDGIGYGIAYGNSKEEIEFARNTRDKRLAELDKIDQDNNESIERFINALQTKYFLKRNGIYSE